MPALKSEAIDFRVASELFANVRRLRPSDLRTLRLTTLHHGREVPTVGGILLFGKQRERHFPDAWIQAGRFTGRDRTRILDTVEIRSPLVQAVEDAIGFVRRHTSHEAVIGEVRRSELWTFPVPAVREAIINAVAHADYSQHGAPIRLSVFSDRLEVENPGLLPFGLTVEDIQRGISKLRNRVIGRVFHELGLIEQWGSGIGRMTQACREAGIDDPLLEEIATHFRVTISGIRRRQPALDETSRAILQALGEGHGLSTQQIAARIKKSSRATRTRLLALVEDGLVVEVGTGPNDPRRRYHLPSAEHSRFARDDRTRLRHPAEHPRGPHHQLSQAGLRYRARYRTVTAQAANKRSIGPFASFPPAVRVLGAGPLPLHR